MQKHAAQKSLTIVMVVCMCLWGVNWPIGKVLTRYGSVVNLTVYRFLLVGVSLVLLLPFLGVSIRIKRKGIPHVLGAGILLALYSYLTFVGLKKGAPGAGGVLVTTLNPIMAYAIGIISRRRLPNTNETIGLVLGFIAGCILLQVWENSHMLFYKGNLYFLVAALNWAVLSMITARGGEYGTSMGFSLWQYLITLICLLPFTDFSELRDTVLHNRDSLFWLNLVFSSVIVTALATTIYFYTTTRLGPEKASSFIFLVPLAAACSSWFCLGERILPHVAIGGILGIAAVYTINKKMAAPVVE